MHDCIVPREAYQDLYLVMRERHKHLVETWQEVTDPLKHVFEASQLQKLIPSMSLIWCAGYRHRDILDVTLEIHVYLTAVC